jgi:uncharacterized protein with NAD-binding domain and iron-sulfur cluster
MNSRVASKQRLLVLGGGPSTLSAVYQLLSREPERWEVSIYEMSWRLGGKIASGRGRHDRIEEHGLHILFGCYHNLFELMGQCYAEVERNEKLRGSLGFRTFFEALEPGEFGKLGEEGPTGWSPWNFQFATNFSRPGDEPLPDTRDLVVVLLQLCISIALGDRALRLAQSLARGMSRVGVRLAPRSATSVAEDTLPARRLLARMFRRTLQSARRRAPSLREELKRLQNLLQRLAPFARSRRGKPWSSSRTYEVVDALIAALRGLVESGVVAGRAGFNDLDDEDLRAWLARYGAQPSTVQGPFVHMIYDAAFSCPEGGSQRNVEDGDYGPLKEQIAAGAALRALLFMAFTFKGAFYYRMRGGTAEVLATPLYLLLREKGVQFHFFHRVRALRPGSERDGRDRIESVVVEQLARCRSGQAYDPLVSVAGKLCWPAQPELSQIVEQDHANALGAERLFQPATRTQTLTLERGRDFDVVLYGLPVGCIPYTCHDILDAARCSPDKEKKKWLDQLHIATVQTLGLQLWNKPSLSELGWAEPRPLLSLFRDPLNTYCDMQQLLESEGWSGLTAPGSLAFFCGPLPHVHRLPPPEAFRLGSPPLQGYEALQATVERQAMDVALKLIERDLGQLWPVASSNSQLAWSLLHDPDDRVGRARLEAQYMSVNWEPQARCTLALPGQTRLRMAAADTGYTNLIVTGDWTDNGIYVACVEGAVQSGIRAARALSGRHELFPIKAEGYLGLGPRAAAPADVSHDAGGLDLRASN